MLRAFLQLVSQYLRHHRIQRKGSLGSLCKQFCRAGTEGSAAEADLMHQWSRFVMLRCSRSSLYYKELALSCRAYCLGISSPRGGEKKQNTSVISARVSLSLEAGWPHFTSCCVFANEPCQTQAVFAGSQLPYLCVGGTPGKTESCLDDF